MPRPRGSGGRSGTIEYISRTPKFLQTFYESHPELSGGDIQAKYRQTSPKDEAEEEEEDARKKYSGAAITEIEQRKDRTYKPRIATDNRSRSPSDERIGDVPDRQKDVEDIKPNEIEKDSPSQKEIPTSIRFHQPPRPLRTTAAPKLPKTQPPCTKGGLSFDFD